MNASQDQKNKFSRKSATIVGMVALVVLVAAGSAPALLRPDGTEKLTGVKQEVAKKALSFEQKNSSVSPMPSFTQQIHVDEVRSISSDEKSKYCTNSAYISDDPNDLRYYAVAMSLHKPFEANSKTVTQYGCSFLQFDEGYLK